MADIDIGDIYRVSVAFTDESDVAADPSDVTFRLRKPDKTTTVYEYGTDAELVKDSTGSYHVDLDIDMAGVWRWRFEGAGGSAAAADEGTFTVNDSAFY